MAREIRLLLDTQTTNSELVDSNTGQNVFLYRAESLTFDVGLLQGGAVFNPSGYTYSLELKERNNPSYTAYFSKTGDITGTLSVVADFDGGSEHFSVSVTAAENENSIAGTGWLIVKIMDGGGSVVTTYAGEVAVLESGSSSLAQGSDYTSGLYITEADKGTVDGVAELDSTGKVPAAQLPVSTTATYKGAWDVATDTPNIGALTPASGDYYIVSVAGTEDVTGDSNAAAEGDQVHYNGTDWEYIPKPSDLKQPMVAANDAARAAATPDYIGQTLDQTDTGRRWRGTALSAGSWEPDGWGDVKRTAADGDVTWYAASADTDAARGTALIDAMDDSAVGDHIEIFNGTYTVPESVLLKSNQTLSGSGAGSVIDGGSLGTNDAVVSNSGYGSTVYAGNTGISVRDFKIANTENGVMIAHTTTFRADRIHCDGTDNNHFFDIIACDDVVVSGCTFAGASPDSVFQIDAAGDGCGFIYDGASQQAVSVEPHTDTTPSRNVRFTGNHSYISTGDVHYHIHRTANSDVQIEGNMARGGTVFCHNDSSTTGHAFTIRGNTVTTAGQDTTSNRGVIHFNGTSSDVTDLVIEGNTIEHAGYRGLFFRECLRVVVADNIITITDDGDPENVLYGLKGETNTSILVTGNTFRHTVATTSQYSLGAAIVGQYSTCNIHARDNYIDNWVQGFYGPGSPNALEEKGTVFSGVTNHVHGVTNIDTSAPPSPGASAVTWFRADRGVDDSTTPATVDSWANRMDSTEAVEDGTDTGPTVVDDPTIDGDALEFDGSSMGLTATIDTIDLGNADFTWWVLVKDDDGGSDTDAKIVVWADGTNSVPVFQIRKGAISPSTGQKLVVQTYVSAYNSVATSSDVFEDTNWKLLKVQREGTSVEVKEATFTKSATGSVHATLDVPTTSKLWFGRRGGTADYWDGHVAEFIAYSGTMSGQAEYDVFRYFVHRYGPSILTP